MNILEELNSVLGNVGIPLETGVFSKEAPDEYIVIVPISDGFGYHADNTPHEDVQEARVSVYSKGNYLNAKGVVVRALLAAEFTITDRRYIGYETETGYHHYVVDAQKNYELED